jgi:hypothetical protein
MVFLPNDRQRGRDFILFASASRLALWSNQLPMKWVPEDLSPGVKRPGREADHTPQSSAEVKNAWNYASVPKYAQDTSSCRGTC